MTYSFYFDLVIFRMLLSILLLSGINAFALYGSELDSLHRVLKNSKDDLEIAKVHSRIGWLSITSDPSAAEAHIDSALNIYAQLNDSSGIANSHYRLGVLNRVKGDYQKAASEIDFYLSYVESKKDTFKIVNGLYQKGVIYSLEGRYEKSVNEYFKILEVYEKLQDSVSIGFTLNSIGIVLKNLRKFDDAEYYLNRAIGIHSRMSDQENLANTFNSLANLYADQARYSEALEYYQKALEIDQDLGIDWGEAMNSMNIGALLIVEGNYLSSLEYLQKAAKIQEENGYFKDLAETYSKLGKAYLEIGDLTKSQSYIDKAEELNVSSLPLERDLVEYQGAIFERKGMFKEALQVRKQEMALRDSIYNIENTRNINALAARYDSDLKDREINSQAIQIQDQEAIINQSRRDFFFATIGIVLSISLLVVLWIVFNQRQKLKDQEIQNLQKQKEIVSLEAFIQGEENERKRVAQDLHDGLNGDLSIIKYKVSSLEPSSEMDDAAKLKQETIDLIDKACQQVRSISHNLAPPVLKDFRLNQALKDYVHNQNTSTAIHIQFQSFGNSLDLDSNSETVIFRMIQEMLNNIVKHSEASEALVQLNWHDDELNIIVEDNGKGFKIENGREGIGLKTIKSRVEYLNAEMELDSSEKGTSFSVHIPIKAQVLS